MPCHHRRGDPGSTRGGAPHNHRGTEYIGNACTLLDLTAFGCFEDWEEPKGRALRRHGADPTVTD